MAALPAHSEGHDGRRRPAGWWNSDRQLLLKDFFPMSDQRREPSGRTAPPQASETIPFPRKAQASLTQRQARLSTGCPPE
ncbi:protein of unknown function [Streptomyces sp. KY75]|nr:protein of unknown function [Streptomyces sp. KY75]CAD5977538.1 protein of unknown function [Streptomyces sp. KY70]